MRLHPQTSPLHGAKPLIAGTLLAIGSITSLASLASLAALIDFAKATQDPETTIVVAVWGLAALSALWLGTSVLYWRQRLDVEGVGQGRLERFTMPGSKQIAKGLLAVTLTVLPACGASDPSPPQLVHLGQADPTLAPPTSATALSTSTTMTPPTEPTTSPPTSEPPTTVAPATTTAPLDRDEPPAPLVDEVIKNPDVELSEEHRVVTGDHLWGIAADTTELRLGRPPTTAEISEYWAKLIATNRTRLASGDPNMIFPGETLVLP